MAASRVQNVSLAVSRVQYNIVSVILNPPLIDVVRNRTQIVIIEVFKINFKLQAISYEQVVIVIICILFNYLFVVIYNEMVDLTHLLFFACLHFR